VPPLRSRSKKPTKLQIAQEKLQNELNKSSNQINIKLVIELQDEIDKLEAGWRKRRTSQKRVQQRRKQPMVKKSRRKPVKFQKHKTPLASVNQKPHAPLPLAKSKTKKLTRLQVLCNQLKKELAKPSEHININRVKELEKRKERLQQEWHNRSRAQKQAWRWRKRVIEILEHKISKDEVKPPEGYGQHSGLPAPDKKICARCPIHCPPVKNIKGHWKNKLCDFLVTVLMQLDAKRDFKDTQGDSEAHISKLGSPIKGSSKTPFTQKITKWIYRYLLQKVKDICRRLKDPERDN
jgi:hypothetical protein